MSQETVVTRNLGELITAIHLNRNHMPDFNPNDSESKEKIERAHEIIHGLVLAVKAEVGFETYEQTLKFIDQEIRNQAVMQ